MKNNSIISIFLMLLITCIYGCGDSFFETDPPGDQLTDANFFVGEKDTQAALIAVYDAIQKGAGYQGDEFSRIEWYPVGDIIVSQGEPADFEYAKLRWDRGFFRLGSSWRVFYNGIARANAVVDGVSNMTDEQLSSEKRALIIAQAKYLRAIMYFPLVRLFGDVPLIVEAPSLDNELFPARTPAAQVWDQIKKDLSEAAPELPVAWDDSELGRATQGSALTMLAKVSLYTQEYDQTIQYAEQVLNLNAYELLENYRDVFSDLNEWNAEIAFATRYSETQVGGWGDDNEGNLNTPLYLPVGVPNELTGNFGGWGGLAPTQSYLDAMPRNANDSIVDERFHAQFLLHGEKHPELDFVYDTAVQSTTGGFPGAFIKYWYKPDDVNGVYSGQDQPVSRFAELLLDYAEALNEVGRTNDALAAINQVRTRAGLPDFVSSDKNEILLRIFEERRVETFYEHNFFSELNRRGLFLDWIRERRVDLDEIDLSKPFLNTTPILMPIPQTELEINPNLVQNPGYDF
ncbi:MAG: RagB/SusD family nutrient uptake outer membrane protein [Tunicatimonas sp.]